VRKLEHFSGVEALYRQTQPCQNYLCGQQLRKFTYTSAHRKHTDTKSLRNHTHHGRTTNAPPAQRPTIPQHREYVYPPCSPQPTNPRQVEQLLHAFGDSSQPLSSTVLVLDEILTDFIIETCHNAALSASYSRRQKIKVDDFKWVLRRDAKKLGRVAEIFAAERMLKENRKAFDLGNEAGLMAMSKKGKKDKEELGLEDEDEDGGKKRGRKKRKIEA